MNGFSIGYSSKLSVVLFVLFFRLSCFLCLFVGLLIYFFYFLRILTTWRMLVDEYAFEFNLDVFIGVWYLYK